MAGGVHLLLSATVALFCAALVFGLWYPPPYDSLANGRQLISMVIAIDIVCGPLLTTIVFNPSKARKELWRDMGVIVVLQLAALSYGMFSVMQARPVWLAFEGDRFRVVSMPDIEKESLKNAPKELRALSLTGPKMLGVRLLTAEDPNFPRSVQLAMQGIPPAFRTDRWVPYEQQKPKVVALAKPLSDLYRKYPARKKMLDESVLASGLKPEQLGYFPFVSENSTEWVAVVGLADAMPRAYLPLDAW